MQRKRKTEKERISLYRFLVHTVNKCGKKSKAKSYNSYMLEEMYKTIKSDIKTSLGIMQKNLNSLIAVREVKLRRKKVARTYFLKTARRRVIGITDCFKYALKKNTSRRNIKETMREELFYIIENKGNSESIAYKKEQIRKAIRANLSVRILE